MLEKAVTDFVDIVALIESTGVTLTRSGRAYSGLCPLHNDKATPSLRVYPNSNSWCCFGVGCGGKMGKHNGGGVIEWVMQRLQLGYRDAVEWLEVNYGHESCVQLPSLPKAKPRPVPSIDVAYWHGLLDECDRRRWFHERGFMDETIEREMFGWDGKRYVVPVWDWEPGFSRCLGVRLRKSDLGADNSPKYKGMTNHNAPTVWGKYYCLNHNLAVAFAGELDAARAVQDGLPAFSVVNGVNAYSRFPDGWPHTWFPDTSYLVVAFDRSEELQAAGLARAWNREKGIFTARVFHWPPDIGVKDYCEFRDTGKSSAEFWDLVTVQISAPKELARGT